MMTLKMSAAIVGRGHVAIISREFNMLCCRTSTLSSSDADMGDWRALLSLKSTGSICSCSSDVDVSCDSKSCGSIHSADAIDIGSCVKSD